jgi:hypothetical protein
MKPSDLHLAVRGSRFGAATHGPLPACHPDKESRPRDVCNLRLISSAGQSPPNGPATTVLSAQGEPVPHVAPQLLSGIAGVGGSPPRRSYPIGPLS